jgi:hypothetical protein
MPHRSILALLVLTLSLSCGHQYALAAEIVGTIKSGVTGQGIARAVVRAIPQQRNRRDVQAQTDLQGRYHLELIRGKYKLFISVPDSNYLPQFYSESGQEQGDTIDVPTFQSFMIINASLASGGSISGRVSRYANAAPVANVRVSVESKDKRLSINTDSEGRYQFLALPPNDYRVRVLALDENYISVYFNDVLSEESADSIHIEAGQEVSGVDFRLRTGGMISGRVYAQKNREPISDIKIIVERQNSKENPVLTHTDTQGFYQLQGLSDGIYVVESGTAKSSGDTSGTRPKFLTQYYDGRFDKELASKIQIQGGNSITGVNFALVQSGKISGAVRSRQQGNPLRDVAIVPQQVQKEFLSPPKGKSNEDGDYVIENLPPGEYILNSTLPPKDRRYVGIYYQDKLGSEVADRIFVEESGWARGIDFNLILGATLKGHFKIDDPEYKFDPALNSIALKRSPPDLEGYGERTYKPTEDGSFMIEGTPPGKYFVAATVLDPNLKLQTNPEGRIVDLFEGDVRDGIDFSLKVGGSISGNVSTKSSLYTLDKLLLILINIKENSKTYFELKSEHYSLNGLDPGKYVLVLLSNPDKTHPDTNFQPTRVFDSRVIEVSKGKTTTGVDFQLASSNN